jgi:ribonuclease G
LRRFYLHVHPFVAAYLRSGGFRSWWWRWKLKYGFRFHLVTDQSMEVLQYKVMDGDGNEVNLKQPIDNHV